MIISGEKIGWLISGSINHLYLLLLLGTTVSKTIKHFQQMAGKGTQSSEVLVVWKGRS